ncbi:MAG TPA: hypothetical protein VLA52_13590 [Thermohalobaculum sp.]|nr:hypothetical protein [Thermohalobaculum sp.]
MAFLVPAVVDFAIAALTLYRMIGVVDDSLVARGQFAGAAFCWGLLLLLGLAKPVARAWILQPTAVVIGCIATAFAVGFVAGVFPIARMALVLVLCGTMIWLCWAGLKKAEVLTQ